jgi:hypothetical protein
MDTVCVYNYTFLQSSYLSNINPLKHSGNYMYHMV